MKKSLLALVLGSALALTACDNAQKTADKTQAAVSEVKDAAAQKATDTKEAVAEKNSSTYGKGPFFLVYTAEGWNHDADEWIGIYTDRKETREAYNRAVAYYEEEAKRSSYRSRQRVVIMEFILEEDRFREVDREELN